MTHIDQPSPFERAVGLVLRFEGGLADDPHDPGGVTNYGVSIRFAGSIGLDINEDGTTTRQDILALTIAEAADIYRQHFWRPLQCDFMHFSLALGVFDCGVNQGVRTSAKLLQRAVGVTADGRIGPVTMGAVNNYRNGPNELLIDFTARRAKRYAITRGVDRYGRGWYRRLLDVYAVGQDELRG